MRNRLFKGGESSKFTKKTKGKGQRNGYSLNAPFCSWGGNAHLVAKGEIAEYSKKKQGTPERGRDKDLNSTQENLTLFFFVTLGLTQARKSARTFLVEGRGT